MVEAPGESQAEREDFHSWDARVDWLMAGDGSGKQMARGAEDRLEKTAAQGVVTNEFHGQRGRTDERAEDPRELAAKQQIARQPAEENLARDRPAATEPVEELHQPQIIPTTLIGW